MVSCAERGSDAAGGDGGEHRGPEAGDQDDDWEDVSSDGEMRLVLAAADDEAIDRALDEKSKVVQFTSRNVRSLLHVRRRRLGVDGLYLAAAL